MAKTKIEKPPTPYTIGYIHGVGPRAVLANDIDGKIITYLTPRRFTTVEAAHRWFGNMGTPPWLVSEDGAAVTTFLGNTATITYTEADGEKHVLMLPLKVFMSMIDDGIHLFEGYHYDHNDECHDDEGEWIPPKVWRTKDE